MRNLFKNGHSSKVDVDIVLKQPTLNYLLDYRVNWNEDQLSASTSKGLGLKPIKTYLTSKEYDGLSDRCSKRQVVCAAN